MAPFQTLIITTLMIITFVKYTQEIFEETRSKKHKPWCNVMFNWLHDVAV